MALNEDEQTLLEAVKTLFQQDPELGLSYHSDDDQIGSVETNYGHLHEQINQLFSIKSSESLHSDSLNQAFFKVHGYKYIDDPTFIPAFEKELTAQGIPKSDRALGTKFIEDIIKELKSDEKEWEEANFGFNKEGMETMPETDLEFNIEKKEDWPMEKNVEFDSGDASPGHMP
jgi:hypothetical protein